MNIKTNNTTTTTTTPPTTTTTITPTTSTNKSKSKRKNKDKHKDQQNNNDTSNPQKKTTNSETGPPHKHATVMKSLSCARWVGLTIGVDVKKKVVFPFPNARNNCPNYVFQKKKVCFSEEKVGLGQNKTCFSDETLLFS